jgi:hypothetical protein
VLRRVAWTLFAGTVLLVTLDIVVAAQAVSLTSHTSVVFHGFPLIHGACVGSALMGALIVSRYPRHPIGWLLALVGAFTSVSLVTESYAYWVQQGGGPDTPDLAGVAAWLANLFGGQIVVALLALMFLLAPNGHLVSRRWLLAALVPAAGELLCLATILTLDPTDLDLLHSEDQLGPVRSDLMSVGFSLISLGLVLGMVSMVRRLRGSSGEERQQLRLVALSAALAAVGLVILFVGQAANGGRQSWFSAIPLFAAFFLMPILFAVAVLRYRLYDLDVIVNRTVLVATGAGFAAVGYTTLVVGASRLVQGRTGGFWISLLAMVSVALAFQPLRRIIVRIANRVAYGARAQPYEALADFTRRLSDVPDPDHLLPAVAEAAAQAVSARGARATLDVPGGAPLSGTWGWWAEDGPAETQDVVPVRTEGRELGRIAVSLPRGRRLSPSDQRLLEALAGQTALAFRNSSLAGALADRVAELDRTTTRLADSRRRLIAAGDEGRRALEAAIAREVLPLLTNLPGGIGEARAAVVQGQEPDIDGLVDRTHAALEALRELTRGVFPTQLSRSGLEPALRSLVARAEGSTRFSATDDARRRFAARVEATVYFCCAEVFRGAAPVSVDLGLEDRGLLLRIVGVHEDVDQAAVIDRVEAVGGKLLVGDRWWELCVPTAAEVKPRRPGQSWLEGSRPASHAADKRSGPKTAFGM